MITCPECGSQNRPTDAFCRSCNARLYVAKLYSKNQQEGRQTFFLQPRDYTVGRDLGSDILIADTSVSRHHATLTFHGKGFSLKDNDSKNGSFVNNYHIKNQRLHHGDRIQLGHAVLQYENDNEPLIRDDVLRTEELVQKEFFKLAENRATILTTDDLLNTMLDLVVWLVHAESAVLFQINQQEKLTFKTGRTAKKQRLPQPELSDAEWLFLHKALQAQKVTTDQNGHGDKEDALQHWRRMALPLRSAQQKAIGKQGLLGLCYIKRNTRNKPLNPQKLDLLHTIMQQLALAIENDLLYAEVADKEKIHFQLSLAKDIQKHLQPASQLKIRHLDVAYFSRPSETISGDYLDIIPLNERQTAIAIGDICGKGVAAAILSSTVRAAIRAQLEYSSTPKTIVKNLNKLFINSTAEAIFFTLFFAIFDSEKRELTYINAGHPPPIYLSADGSFSELKATTLALGILDEDIDEQLSIPFRTGESLILYTDGIIESQDSTKAIYSRKRLLNFVCSLLTDQPAAARPPDYFVQKILQDVHDFTRQAAQSDDLTLMVVKHIS